MNFEDSMDYNTSMAKQFQKNGKQKLQTTSDLPFNMANEEYKRNNSNSFDSLIINPPRSNSTVISQSSNDRDTNDSDESADCENSDDFDNLSFIINPQQKSQLSYTQPANSFNRNFSATNASDGQNKSYLSSINTILPNTQNNSLTMEKNTNFNEEYLNSINKYQYLLMANTSPAVKINEETLTYLNQGQSYELKFNKTNYIASVIKKSDSDNEDLYKKTDKIASTTEDNDDQMYLSIIRLCFWERKLQEIEDEEIKEVRRMNFIQSKK